jgi:hypothetical protein
MRAMSAITRDHGDPLLCIFPLTLRPTYLNILGVRRFDHYGLEPQRESGHGLKSQRRDSMATKKKAAKKKKKK